MTLDAPLNPSRLELVDSLRGFALLAIVLLHNLEHYNLYFIPADMPEWLKAIDQWVWDITFFLMAGKAYATFSLLFGFSFYIQFRNEQERGGDFRLRFAWRMFLLFLFSQLHALFYNGDILLLYSVVGLLLIPVCKLKDRTVFIIAAICLFQPFEWGRIVYASLNPDYVVAGKYFVKYAKLAYPVMKDGTFLETLKSNIWDGQLFSNIWQVEHGRLFQTAALFMFGMLLGRKKYFVKSEESIRFWKRIFIASAIAFIPLFCAKTYIPGLIENKSILVPLNIALPSYSNFAFMSILVSGFALLWFQHDGFKIQKLIIPYGRMSLTNYISQSIIGVCIYYGCGLGLYKYTGATVTLFIGFLIFALQLMFSRWWLTKYKQGPLELVWRKGTWLGKR